MKRVVFDFSYHDVSLADAGGKGMNLARLWTRRLPRAARLSSWAPPPTSSSWPPTTFSRRSSRWPRRWTPPTRPRWRRRPPASGRCSPPAASPTRWRRPSPLPMSALAGGAAAARGRALLRHGRGPARHVLRRPAGDLPQRHRRRPGWWPPSATAGPACGPPGPWATGRATASRPATCPWPWSSRIMVPAEAAGVLFTANPVTGRRDEMVIDASLGLGEAVVSGQVEPDRYVVRRARRRRAANRPGPWPSAPWAPRPP